MSCQPLSVDAVPKIATGGYHSGQSSNISLGFDIENPASINVSAKMNLLVRRCAKWLLLLSPILLLWGACRLLTFDNSQNILRATLYLPNGDLDATAFTRALSAKFPDGATASSLTQFVSQLDGRCNTAPYQHPLACTMDLPKDRPAQCVTQDFDGIYCSIPFAGTFCVSSSLDIKAALSPDKKISNIGTKLSSLAC